MRYTTQLLTHIRGLDVYIIEQEKSKGVKRRERGIYMEVKKKTKKQEK